RRLFSFRNDEKPGSRSHADTGGRHRAAAVAFSRHGPSAKRPLAGGSALVLQHRATNARFHARSIGYTRHYFLPEHDVFCFISDLARDRKPSLEITWLLLHHPSP